MNKVVASSATVSANTAFRLRCDIVELLSCFAWGPTDAGSLPAVPIGSFYRSETYKGKTPRLPGCNWGVPIGLRIGAEPRSQVRNVAAQPGSALVRAPGKDGGTEQHPCLPFEQGQDASGFVTHRANIYHEEDGSFLQTLWWIERAWRPNS